MGLSSIPLTTLIEFGLGDSRYRRRCGVRFINVFWSLLASIMILVYCNVPTGSATASTFSSDGFTQFQCSDAGYSIADSSGSTGGAAGRSRFAQSPAAIALLKSMLKEQKLAEVRKTPSSIFLKECGCQHDWMSAFCLRADKYKTMDVVKAPTVCICRRKDEEDKTCSQFLARCFPTAIRSKSLTSNSRPSEIPSGSCSCCFNQPDNYCTQLECRRMQPDFGKTNHTSCICYNQANYPHHICASSSPDQPLFSIEQWSGGVTPIEGVIAVTSRPHDSASSSARSKPAESWLTQRMSFMVGAALFAFLVIVCGAVLFIKCNKERRKKTTTLELEGQLEESNELNHMNEDRDEDGFLHTQTVNVNA